MRVLLEGVSDVAAVRALAATRGVDLRDTLLVDLGGVTNVRRQLTIARQLDPDAEIVGLCDAGEAHVVLRVLASLGCPARDASDLPAYGFFVCRADLEDELIRALGAARAVAVIDRIGLGAKFAALQRQPAWQDRPVAAQVRRFCGVASGRKEWLAAQLAADLMVDEVPEPLAQLLDRIAAGAAPPQA